MEQLTKYQNKYRIPSTRLPDWDYAGEGIYFVTICTQDRECYFGTIQNDKMDLSPAGKMTVDYWREIPKHFPFVRLDEFIVMPNHVHGIIMINHDYGHDIDDHGCRDEAMPRLYTDCKYNGQYPQMSKISPKPNSLSVIIGSFKSICTKHIRKLHDPHFQWQARFHDHIIRDKLSFEKIRQYIHENPGKWDLDRNNTNYFPSIEGQNERLH